MDEPIVVAFTRVDRIIDLRHRILRHGLPREAAKFPNDLTDDCFHVAAFDGACAIGCATFHAGTWRGKPAWQLRGMATDLLFQGRGVGRRVLQAAERLIAGRPLANQGIVRTLWANARVGAIDFYRATGWTIEPETFEIPTAGLHHKISKVIAESLQDSVNVTTPANRPAGVNLGRYEPDSSPVEHCCEPTAGVNRVGELIALQDLPQAAAVTIDYSTVNAFDTSTFDCACGARSCRKRIGAPATLPTTIAHHYRTLGIISSEEPSY